MIIHDIIKVRFVELGYLPDENYRQAEDAEMFDAFIYNEPNYFTDTYPCPCSSLSAEYDLLVSEIKYHIEQYRQNDGNYSIPNWIYSYMLGSVIGEQSSDKDKHDLLNAIGAKDNDRFTESDYLAIYEVSKKWLDKLAAYKKQHRPPSMFGELHVQKALRLANYF